MTMANLQDLGAQDLGAAGVQTSLERMGGQLRARGATSADARQDGGLRSAFDAFVGQTFYGQLLSAMRKTVGKPAYFHGGRGEEVFQAQLDQVLAEHMTEASANQFSGPMFDLFTLPRG